MQPSTEHGWHATPGRNEAAIDREGLIAPFSISIGWPVFAGMLLDMEGPPLVIYGVNLYGVTLYPDDDGPPNFQIRENFLPSKIWKISYCIAEDSYVKKL